VAGLADHDGTGADEQDGGDICSFGHQLSDWELGTKKGRACCASPKPRARVTLARGWSLDQIPHPRNPQNSPINRHFGGNQMMFAEARVRSSSYGVARSVYAFALLKLRRTRFTPPVSGVA